VDWPRGGKTCQARRDALMPLTMHPTGLGSGIDKDRADYRLLWRISSRADPILSRPN
jgi:hypothetical protein